MGPGVRPSTSEPNQNHDNRHDTGVRGSPRNVAHANDDDWGAAAQKIGITNDENCDDENNLQLGSFVGEHGAYQMSLTVLLFIRYVFLGLMANSGPLMTPDVTFYCQLPEREILMIMPNITLMSERERELEIKEEFKQICQIDLHLYQNQSFQLLNQSSKPFKTSPLSSGFNRANTWDNLTNTTQRTSNAPEEAQQGRPAQPQPSRIRECTDFTYQLAPDQGNTMTSEFDLVCDRDWLRSLFQSLLSAAIVVAHVFWGTFSDKYGRFQAQRICLVVSLAAGLLSIFAWDFWSFTLMRALCSFGDLGLVVSMTTTLVELVGSKYRGCSVAAVNFGYALGVSLLPYIVAYFEDFRLVIGFTVLCHMVTMPLVLATNESVRWLLTNRRFKSAKRELKRIVRLNRRANGLTGLGGTSGACGGMSKSEWAREQKRKFEAQFEEFISQIESQNFCDPVVAQQQQPRPSPLPGGPRAGSSTPASPRLALSERARRATLFAPPLIVTTPPPDTEPTAAATNVESLPAPKPRILEMLDPQQLERIKEVESAATDSSSSSSEQRKRTHSHSGLLNETLIRSLEMRHDQRRLLEAKMKTLTLPPPGSTGVAGRPSLSRASSLNSDLNVLACSLPNHDEEGFLRKRRFYDANGSRPPAQQQPDCINLVAHQLSFVGRVSRLFKDKKLMIAVFTIVWTTFNSELLYTSFIIINLEVGEDLYLNYILGGCMEALAAIMASLLLSYSPRRISLIAFWLLISFACFGLSLAHIDSTWAVWMLALAKFSQSCLSSIATVAAYESFPTFLRQSGSGLVFTLGMLGSVFAPLIFAEFDDHAGMDRVLMTFSVSSLTAASLIYLFLNETRDCELM